jgi:hypothetical protein
LLHNLTDPYLLRLKPGTKVPDPVYHPHGHLQPVKGPLEGNYGIVLDGQYLVVDIDSLDDAPDDIINRIVDLKTWSQFTRKGYHYLFTVPEGFTGKNTKLKNADGFIYGDLKVRGYIVGPGSVVDGHLYRPWTIVQPVPAPSWLLELAKPPKEVTTGSQGALKGIPKGAHDDFLISLGGFLREKHSLEASAIAPVLAGAVKILQDQDPEDPYTADDIRRLATASAKYETSIKVSILPQNWRNGADVTLTGMDTRWLLHRFVPQGQFTLIYGKGGCGKSSWASWLAAKAIAKGMKVGISSVEESFETFLMRMYLSDPNVDFSMIYDIGNEWKFPRDGKALKEAIQEVGLDLVYFDSIYNHFDNNQDHSNAAEKGRNALSPLAQACQETGVTIVGTFHENKAGQYLGTTEMENVVRSLLHMTRKGKDHPALLKVKKTNFIAPEHDLKFYAEEVEAITPDGQAWREETKEGVMDIRKMIIIKSAEEVEQEDEEEEDIYKKDDRYEEAVLLRSQGLTMEQIGEKFGIHKSNVSRLLKKNEKFPEGVTFTP